jgi:aminobenzoyl-glutamate utilization protein B
MNAGWNYRREHLRLQQRSHYVITDGGDQPNVVPSKATVWYFFRETEYPRIRELWEIGDKMAQGASLMTETSWTSRIVGAAWPQHFSKPVAEAMFTNVQRVGLPKWSEDDQAFAKAVQKEIEAPLQSGLDVELDKLGEPIKDEDKRGGGSDDIGDVSWTVPTVMLRYPANIPGLPGHNWANGIAMATPIAHKGVVAGAKVQAMTMVDILLRPELVKSAWEYFMNVQLKDMKYTPFIAADTPPPTWVNKDTMERYRPELKKFYYDPSRYGTYLEQLGITYPMLRRAGSQ